jgi:hypothetical protein
MSTSHFPTTPLAGTGVLLPRQPHVGAQDQNRGGASVSYPESTNQLVLQDTDDLQPLQDDLEQLKVEGLTGGTVAVSFYRLIQPI